MLEGSPVPRARRYPIEARILYRHTGSNDWYEGRTLNISVSGVRFRAPHVLARHSQIEMDLVFTPGMDASPPVRLRCQGSVVDTITPRSREQLPVISARIRKYNFLRPEPGPVDSFVR